MFANVDIDLIRHYFTDTYIIGKLYVSGEYVCDTLEPSLTAVHPCVPCGSYSVVMRQSPKFGKLMPTLLSVPHRSGILIHTGNSAKDTNGCILLGYNDVVGGLLNSRRAFNWFIALMASNDAPVFIHIKNK